MRAWFTYPMVDSVMESIMKAPSSKATKIHLQHATNKLIGHLETLLWFLELGFLSEKLPENDPLGQLLLNHFKNRNDETYQYVLHNLTIESLENIEGGKSFEVFESLLYFRKIQNVIIGIIASTIGPWTEQDETVANTFSRNGANAKLLVGTCLWHEKQGDRFFPQHRVGETDVLVRSRQYRLCVVDFPKVYQAVIDFLSHPEYLNMEADYTRMAYEFGVRHPIVKKMEDYSNRDFESIMEFLLNHYDNDTLYSDGVPMFDE